MVSHRSPSEQLLTLLFSTDMKGTTMDAEFFRGLFLYILIILSPVFMAWLWKKRQDRKRYQHRLIYFTPRQLDNSGWHARQKAKDDHIFNTVEEYRNVNP